MTIKKKLRKVKVSPIKAVVDAESNNDLWCPVSHDDSPCGTQCAWYNVAYDGMSGVSYAKCKDAVIGELVEDDKTKSEVNNV